MGIHTRVGLAAGALGFVLLFVAQLPIGVAAVVLAPVVGLGAGLGTAKWLPRDWYGRQLEAGARAGLLACGMAVGGFLVSLIVAGAHTTATLAARSHLAGIDLGPVVHALGVVGWLGAGLALALMAWVVGIGVAALAGQIGAWDKNQHAIEVVARARAAAQTGRLAAVARRTAPHLRATLSPDFATPPPGSLAPLTPTPPLAPLTPPPPDARPTPAFPAPPPLPGAPDPHGDLAGLNESWHLLRSPLNVFPPPAAPVRPWTRHDERLPPGALLPDDFALDPDAASAADVAGGSVAPDANIAPAGAVAPGWDGAAWQPDAGWMDYADSGDQGQPAGGMDAPLAPAGGVDDDEAVADDAADGEADNWLN